MFSLFFYLSPSSSLGFIRCGIVAMLGDLGISKMGGYPGPRKASNQKT